MKSKTKVKFNNPLIFFFDEIWKHIKKDGCNLKVSNLGQVIIIKNDGTEKLLNQYILRDGYNYVKPCINGKGKHFAVHRLVAEVFKENPKNKPQVNHIDGVKNNNYIDNLEWCTASENMKHAFRTGLNNNPIGENNHAAKLKDNQVREIKEDLSNGIKQKEIALKFGVTQSHISRIKREICGKHIKIISFRNLNEFF